MEEIKKYGSVAKSLHWFIGLIVIIMLIAGRGLEDLDIPERTEILMVHSGLGTLVLLLMILRLAWRKTHQPPMPEDTMGDLQIKLSSIMHWTLYALLIFQPIFGILQAAYVDEYRIIAFGLIDYSVLAANDESLARIFHILHGLNATILSVLVLGHIGAGLYHHFIQKDKTLRRMMPFGKVD